MGLDDLRHLIALARCFICGVFVPPGRDPVCIKCLRDLEEWDKVNPT